MMTRRQLLDRDALALGATALPPVRLLAQAASKVTAIIEG